MSRRALFVLASATIAGGLLGAAVWLRDSGAAAGGLEVSGPMPPVQGEALGGGRVSPALYRDKVVVVNVWASWCTPCRLEQPGLERLWRRYRHRGVQFIGIDFYDDRAGALAYLDEFGVTYPSVPDPRGALAFRFGMLAPPTTFLVDRDGEMRYHLLGAQAEDTIAGYIEELLAEGSG